MESKQVKICLGILAIICGIAVEANAQRMRHGGMGGGMGGRSMSRPSGNTTINGGAQRNMNRSTPSNMQRPPSGYPTTRQGSGSPANQPSRNNQPGVSQRDNAKPNVSDRSSNINNSGNRTGNKAGVGDRAANINSGNRDVNINIDNSRNTIVRPAYRPYPRPPYAYGGFHYYCFHPYFYHPYRPFYWGPYWHPWGFFIATMATTAIIISIENQQYYYDQGVYYIESNGGYTVVQAPVGATIKTLPEGAQTVQVTETVNNYYYGGTYYEKTDDGYTVAPPTAGTVVENLPEGGEEVKVGDVTYVKFGETYYQPIQQNGKNMYEVVEVKEGE